MKGSPPIACVTRAASRGAEVRKHIAITPAPLAADQPGRARTKRRPTPRAEAFQQAMQVVRTTNPHPAAWAPFVLVGKGR